MIVVVFSSKHGLEFMLSIIDLNMYVLVVHSKITSVQYRSGSQAVFSHLFLNI